MARVLVVGSGSREHALAWTLARSGHAPIVAPGNAGTRSFGRNADVRADDLSGLVALAKTERVELVVVGPEAPLVLGLADALAEAKIPCFGPSKAAARLEGSKAFMKAFLKRHRIPTADFVVVSDRESAHAHVRRVGRPLVVKTDGLAAGKGVVVASTVEETLEAIDAAMVHGAFGNAGRTLVLEERLAGEEASFHVLCDGARALALPAAQDHKRIFDGDRGPNTGGMGAYAPAPVVTASVQAEVLRAVVEPTLRGLADEGTPFRGVLFVGLMIDQGTPRVLEFNVRFGDPEACVLLPLLPDDPFALLHGAAIGQLPDVPGERQGAALGVVMASEGYPAPPRTGDAIEGLEAAAALKDVLIFHAGTRRGDDGILRTSGGRVLTVVGLGADLEAARRRAYEGVSHIRWRGEQHRSDIGWRALKT
jgi:phosphoribosylamine--glycine ligase